MAPGLLQRVTVTPALGWMSQTPLEQQRTQSRDEETAAKEIFPLLKSCICSLPAWRESKERDDEKERGELINSEALAGNQVTFGASRAQ